MKNVRIVYNGEMDPRPCKSVLAPTIQELVENDPDVVYLDADLMSCAGTLGWATKTETGRAIECGVAEANMIGVACGMSAVGLKPIVHSFAPFASRRVFDQIFLSGGYAKNTITVVGTDPGVTATLNGGTHMPFEDIAVYNTIPGAVIIDSTDPTMLKDMLRQCVYRPGVKYIRVGRKSYARVYGDGSTFEIGRAVTLREGTDLAIFAVGIMIHEAMQAAEQLEKEGIRAAVIDSFTIKPLDREAVIQYARQTGAVLVAENHNKMGGLFSSIAEVLVESAPVPAACVAVEDEFGEVGPQSYLQQRFGLTAAHIVNEAKELVARK